MSERPYVGCSVKKLPEHKLIQAARTAVDINPANAPPPHAAALWERVPAPTPDEPAPAKVRLALLTSKFWGTGGVNLTVAFLDNPTASLRKRILGHANAWGSRANVQFREVSSPGNAQVRILRESGEGYWSFLGTDILHIPASQPTMNLDSFTDGTPDSEFFRVVRHEVGHCLTGDTLIDCPRDLEKYPLGIPIRDLIGQTPWVYAWKDGRVVVRQASRVWLSKRNVPTVRVRLRPGQGGRKSRTYLPPQELTGTADHPVLLADGKTWKNLGDLKPGDRLCSLYRQKNGRRTRLSWTGGNGRVREHVLVAEEVYGPRPERHDCHHRDGRMLNQSPENLEWKDEHAHHSDHSRGRKDSEGTGRRRSAAQAGRRHTAESRAKMSASHRGKTISEETREKIGAASRGKKQTPETVAKRTAAMNRFYQNGGKSGMYGKKASEETRRKQSESMKARVAVNHTVVSVEPAGCADVYDMTVPNADSFVANGVVVHNSLGFAHEHPRRQIVNMLDPAKTLAYFKRTQGWTEADIYAQVLTPLDDATITATPDADVLSIMCYALPADVTRNGQSIPGGNDINENDYRLAAKLYPRAAQPPTPPPGPAAALFHLDFGRAVREGALVRVTPFPAPRDIPAGKYDVVPTSGRDAFLTAFAQADE